MMNPVVRVFVQRADARRHSLLDLAKAIPEDYFDRRASAEDWTARTHLLHALAIDRPISVLVGAVLEGLGEAELVPVVDQLIAARSEQLRMTSEPSLVAIIEEASNARQALVEMLSRLAPDHLAAAIPMPGARTPWGDSVSLSVFQYLDQWCNHDVEHEAAIRLALATRPDLSTVALTRRLR